MREIIEVIVYLYIGILIGLINLFSFMFSSISTSIVYLVIISIVLVPKLGIRGIYLIAGFYIANLL